MSEGRGRGAGTGMDQGRRRGPMTCRRCGGDYNDEQASDLCPMCRTRPEDNETDKAMKLLRERGYDVTKKS